MITLRTREQDIRRERRSSNVCTNQTLIAVGCAVHLAWLGPSGLAGGRLRCARGALPAGRLEALPGVRLVHRGGFCGSSPCLSPRMPTRWSPRMAEEGFLAGVPLGDEYPERRLLVAVTERRTRAQIDAYVAAMEKVMPVADAGAGQGVLGAASRWRRGADHLRAVSSGAAGLVAARTWMSPSGDLGRPSTWRRHRRPCPRCPSATWWRTSPG